MSGARGVRGLSEVDAEIDELLEERAAVREKADALREATRLVTKSKRA